MGPDPRTLYLPRFLPYRLTKLAGIVSRSLAPLYSDMFDLTIHEWRIVAILGFEPGLTAREIGPLASLDKVSMSRAIDRLAKAGRLEKKTLAGDRRSAALYLTDAGSAMLAEIIPFAQRYEDRLLEDFSPEEIETLDSLLNRLDDKADELRAAMKGAV
jgi:DNA-binding MarR family transcriptional regulator